MTVINEFVFNHTGTDTNEYIELYRAPDSAAEAGTLSLVLVDGDGTQSGIVTYVQAVGGFDANGFFFTGYLNNQLQNGTQTLLLVTGTAAVGQDLDTNDDGVLDTTPWSAVIDAVAVSDGGASDRTYSAVVLGTAFGGGFAPGGASRVPNGTDTNSIADWKLNDFDGAGIPGFSGTVTGTETANTPNATNGGETQLPAGFIITTPGGAVVAEGGAGDTISVRLATQPTADVVIAVTPDGQLTTSTGQLVFTPLDWNIAQSVVVNAVDDTVAEGTHAGTVVLGAAASTDSAYGGLDPADVTVAIIDNDVPALKAIAAIQGAGHISPELGRVVTTTGIVVARDTSGTAANGQRGFYIQDPVGDGDARTSEGLFVSVPTGALPNPGDAVQVSGTVVEFLVGGASTNLTTTRLEGVTTTVLSTGNALPGETIGAGFRLPPGTVIEDDAFASFDVTTDGIDFYESLEGMRVTVLQAEVTGPTNSFGETWVVSGDTAGLRTNRGGILLQEFDTNPERIQLQTDTGITPGISLSANVGATLGSVTGVVRYDFGNYELALTAQPIVASNPLLAETTALSGGPDTLTVANYNAENLAFTNAASKFAALAGQIVGNLGAPDILALQEVQDNDGATDSGTVDANLTLDRLVDFIVAAGGPAYQWLQVNPVDGEDGGQPGGNIRNAYLYNPDRVDFVPGSLFRITDPAASGTDDRAFEASRKPLVATFQFQGQDITLVNNHFTSKSGSTTLFGATQPPINLGEQQRADQAALVLDFVEAQLATDPAAKLMVLGDLNEFTWLPALEVLTGGPNPVLTDLGEALLQAAERYSYLFEGQSQTLDHTLVSAALLPGAQFDEVHINAEFADQVSDHDPSVAALRFAGTIQVELWGANVFPGASATRAPEFYWRDKATELHYTAANTPGVQLATAATDSATGASANRFSSLDGDIAISQLDFAAAASRGTAGGAALVTLDWTGDSTALVRSDAAWGTLKGLRIDSFTGDSLRLEGFVDMHIALNEATRDLTVVADGLRRGTIETGSGDDIIVVGFDSVDATWGNTVVVNAGAGNDVVSIGASLRNYISGRWDLLPSSTIVTGGAGDDTLVGAASRDTAVYEGRLADYAIAVNAGVTTVIGADGIDTITDFEVLRFADATLTYAGGIWA